MTGTAESKREAIEVAAAPTLLPPTRPNLEAPFADAEPAIAAPRPISAEAFPAATFIVLASGAAAPPVTAVAEIMVVPAAAPTIPPTICAPWVKMRLLNTGP